MRGATLARELGLDGDPISIHTPHAGSDYVLAIRQKCSRYFNPHSPCGERPRCIVLLWVDVLISIHTPHAGSDCTGSAGAGVYFGFQSTLPMRGATMSAARTMLTGCYFNPHSPCGERLRALPLVP